MQDFRRVDLSDDFGDDAFDIARLFDPDDATPGKVGGAHPPTSRRAAANPRFGSQRYFLLIAFAITFDLGSTVAEAKRVLTEKYPNVSRNQWATRCLELRECGLVTERRESDVVVTRPTDHAGNLGTVWIATEEGMRWIEKMKSENPPQPKGI